MMNKVTLIKMARPASQAHIELVSIIEVLSLKYMNNGRYSFQSLKEYFQGWVLHISSELNLLFNLLRLFQSESDPSMGPGTPTGSVHGGCGGGGEGGGLLYCYSVHHQLKRERG